jgi:AcrR family transcriptional regulator
MVLRASLEKKEEKERVRLALLQAALRLAAAHGFASLGLREVAREAGIAPTSFYRHFSDMEELGMALIRELGGGVRREVAARVLSAPQAEVVPVLIDSMFAITARDPELVRFLIAERVGAFPGFRALLRAEQAALASALHAADGGTPLTAANPAPAAVDAAISLLFDACGRLLDDAASRQAALRAMLASSIRALLAPERGEHA